jgi:hypothetical protein
LETNLIESKEKVCIGGNITILTQYFQKICDKENVKIAFFGDHYLNHFVSVQGYKQTAESKATWNTFAVLPELCFFEGEARKREDPNLILLGGYFWGASNFVYDSKTEENIPSFFSLAIQNYCRYAIPLLEDLPKFMTETELEESESVQEEEPKEDLN